MQNFPFLTREVLNQRHRLSHQQIDDLLNEKYAKEHVSEKHDQMFQVSEFIKLSDALREATIPFIPLKGPMLSYRLHKDSCYRNFWDLDFLIPLYLIKNALHVLEKLGYEPYYFDWPTNSNLEGKLINWHHDIAFVHPENQIYIEIHWKLFINNMTDSKIISDVIKSNRTQIRFNERNFQVFNHELELLYLIIHGGLHAWSRLKWLVDVNDFIQRIPYDLKIFSNLTEQWKAHRLVSLCNTMLKTYFPECPLLPCKAKRGHKMLIEYSKVAIENELEDSDSLGDQIKRQWFIMHCFPGVLYKLKLIKRLLITRVYIKHFRQIKSDL